MTDRAAGELDGALLRRAFGCFPSGVAAACAMVDGEPEGIAVSSLMSVSLEPPLLSICVARASATWPRLRRAGHLGINVLAHRHGAACRRLAGPRDERFAGLRWEASADGAILLDDVAAAFDCSIADEVGAGDHDIVVLEIHAVRMKPEISPLVFHRSRFHRLLAG